MSMLDTIAPPAKELLGLIASHAPGNIAPYAKLVEGVAEALAAGETEEALVMFAKDCMTLASDAQMKEELK
jgi:hypothetical protein